MVILHFSHKVVHCGRCRSSTALKRSVHFSTESFCVLSCLKSMMSKDVVKMMFVVSQIDGDALYVVGKEKFVP